MSYGTKYIREELTPEQYVTKWAEDRINAATKKKGGARCSRRDVERYASMEALIRVAKQRGYHVIESGDHVIILDDQPLHVHC